MTLWGAACRGSFCAIVLLLHTRSDGKKQKSRNGVGLWLTSQENRGRRQKKKPDYWDPLMALARLAARDQLIGERARVDTISTIQGIDPNDAVAITDILEHTKTASTKKDALAAREAYLYGYYGIPDSLLSRHLPATIQQHNKPQAENESSRGEFSTGAGIQKR